MMKNVYIIDAIIDYLSDRWFIREGYDYTIKAIKLSDNIIYHDNELEFYIVSICEEYGDIEAQIRKGYYNTLSISSILKYIPVEEADISDELLSLFVKNLLGGNK